MRTLAIWSIFWIFIVPSLVGSILILAFLATVVPPLHFGLTWFVRAFSTCLAATRTYLGYFVHAVRPLSFRLLAV